MWFKRNKPSPADFEMPIDDAFALKAVGRVVVVGLISAGEIKPGMQLSIKSAGATISVKVVAIEMGPGNQVKSAKAGDRIGAMLEGAEKIDLSPGSYLIAN